ncbi:MAG: hemerythrin domain-containing protein [Tuberibacillus sp.]
MKRHKALYPLSHHHHHALVAALKLKRAGTEKSQLTPEQIVKDVEDFWANGGNDHFREEEEILLPAFAQFAEIERPEITDNLLEHVKIRSLVDQVIKTKPASIELMHQLGEMLEAHVRKEERVIFPMIEEALPEEKLMALAPYFHMNAEGDDDQ